MTLLAELPVLRDPDLLVGYDSSDGACVYRVTDEIASIHAVDFFTPIVDDPYLLGQIAAANVLSSIALFSAQGFQQPQLHIAVTAGMRFFLSLQQNHLLITPKSKIQYLFLLYR